jgi:hypothetical protein
MAVLIHVHQGLRTLYLTFCQRFVQFSGSSERADKISRGTFPNPESANNALHAGKVIWESFAVLRPTHAVQPLRQAWRNGCAELDRTGRQITGRRAAMMSSRIGRRFGARSEPGTPPCGRRLAVQCEGCGCAHKRKRPRRSGARTFRTSPQKTISSKN